MTEAHRIEPRICASCAHDFGVDGSLPWSADVHCEPGTGRMFVTCSPSCRLKLALSERKVGARG